MDLTVAQDHLRDHPSRHTGGFRTGLTKCYVVGKTKPTKPYPLINTKLICCSAALCACRYSKDSAHPAPVLIPSPLVSQ